MKPFLILPIRGTGDGVGDACQHHKGKIDQESGPYQDACTAIAPHLAHHVVDNVGNRKDQQPSCQMERPKTICLVSSMLDAIKHTAKMMLNCMNSTDTIVFFFLLLIHVSMF